MSRRSWLHDLLGAPAGSDIDESEGLATSPITRWLDSAPAPLFSAYAIAAAFCTYFCMYAFRKPFAAASYEDVALTIDILGRSLDIKTVFVISQIIGYCASKYIGMKFCSEVARSKRFLFLIGAIVFAETALLLFAVLPVPLKIGAIFLNGLPLGVVWGLVVRYLEGRRTSEMLLAGLSCSYILASGEVKRFGTSLMLDYGVAEFWMPAATGACFFVPFALAAFLLKQLPPPTEEDERLRTERHRMLSDDRWRFMKTFLPGMIMLSVAYFFLTAFRDYRDNYQADMFREIADLSGEKFDAAMFSRTERPIAFGVMLVLAALTLIKSNRWGLIGAYVIMIGGLVTMAAGTALFQAGVIGGEMWMILTGLGGYLAYVPYGSVLFDRTIAYSRFVGTAVFAIYLTDAIGYTGSVGLQLYKDLFSSTKSRLLFFQNFTYFMAAVGAVLMVMSLVYFLGKGGVGEETDQSALNQATAMHRISGKIAVFEQARGAFQLCDIELPPPANGELVVGIDLCTICGSDLHTIHGRRPLHGPTVLGHEMVGRVVALPATAVTDIDGKSLRIGDRITWSIHASCGSCFYCRDGLTQKCQQLFKYGHDPVSATYPSTGGFASHCQVRTGTALIRVPDVISDAVASPINCATSTVAAAFRQLDGCQDRCVLILGAGMLGLTAAAMAKERGAASVVVVDPKQARANKAIEFGADQIAVQLSAARDAVNQLTEGRGADVSFDFAGSNEAVLAAIHFLRTGGQAVLVGSVFPTESISINPEMIVRRWLRISGVHNYSPTDMLTAVRFLSEAQTRYPFQSLVAAQYHLDDIEAAVKHASAGDAVRVGIRPGTV